MDIDEIPTDCCCHVFAGLPGETGAPGDATPPANPLWGSTGPVGLEGLVGLPGQPGLGGLPGEKLLCVISIPASLIIFVY